MVALVLRRQLDDARYCVADAFMTLFPAYFPRNVVSNIYEKTNTTVIWSVFLDKLDSHYWWYHTAFPDHPHQARFYVYQEKPVLRYTDPDDSYILDHADALPNEELFNKFTHQFIGECLCKNGWLASGESYSALLKHQLNFFHPLLIW